MPLRRKKSASAQAQVRAPHPDPAVELQLRRILDLQASISRRAALIDGYRSEVARLNEKGRHNVSYPMTSQNAFTRADELDEKIRDLEGEIAPVHEQIAALQDKLSPTDLAYL